MHENFTFKKVQLDPSGASQNKSKVKYDLYNSKNSSKLYESGNQFSVIYKENGMIGESKCSYEDELYNASKNTSNFIMVSS